MTKKVCINPPPFLRELLAARSPSGYEAEAQAVIDNYLQPIADSYSKDRLGNRFATLHNTGKPTLMFAGHMDELGLIIRYIDDQGFLYFDTIGGHDKMLIPSRRVTILTAKGEVKGVTGKRAIHLLSPDERKKVPELHQQWIDIGVSSKKEASRLVAIGDPVVFNHDFEMIRGSIGVSRAFDNKSGCYVVCETLRRLAKVKKALAAKVVAVATTQEEIGIRGAITASHSVNPDIAVAVDVGHATDYPDCDKRKLGEFKLGQGPIICRGANINPIVYQKLITCAKRHKIPYQLEADPRPTGTDARSIQVARDGVATGLVSIPLRYMHTSCELIDINDAERTIKLLVAFAKSLGAADQGIW